MPSQGKHREPIAMMFCCRVEFVGADATQTQHAGVGRATVAVANSMLELLDAH